MGSRRASRHVPIAVLSVLAGLMSLSGAASASGGGTGLPAPVLGNPNGGAPIVGGGLDPTGKPVKVPPPPSKHAHGRWLRGVTVTEYWPAPESWFVGKLVNAPGLPGRHRVDWLYSATG